MCRALVIPCQRRARTEQQFFTGWNRLISVKVNKMMSGVSEY